MKTRDEIEGYGSYEEVVRDKEVSRASTPSSSGNNRRNEDFQVVREKEMSKDLKVEEGEGATPNRFFVSKTPSPVPRSASVYDNRSESNAEVVLRPKNGMFSAVVAPSERLLHPKKWTSSGELDKIGHPRKTPSTKTKHESMVLKLVLPSGNQINNRDSNSNNYLSVRSMDEILGNGHLKERASRPHSMNMNTQQDYYLPRPEGGYLNRAYSSSACELTEYGHPAESPGGYSISLTPAPSNDQEKPTSPEEKKRAFTSLLTNVLSVFYALFNITLGLAVYASDIVGGTSQLAEIFSLILVSIAFVYVLYLVIDIHLHMKKKRHYETLLDRNTPETIEMKETADGHYQFNIPLPEVVTLKRQLKHDYCFMKDRHSRNFYLKIGAAGFCFGHLIHSGLILGYQLVFLVNDEEAFYECATVATLVLDFMYPVYSFLLLFFMFKYSNVIINKHWIVARFGVMHCLSSSVCFWVWTIFRETMEALANKGGYNETTTVTSMVTDSDYHELPYDLPHESIEISPRRFTAVCELEDESLSTIYRDYSPYLYPFSVEYSILVVGVLYLVWQNVGACMVENDAAGGGEEEASLMQCRAPSGNRNNTESNIVVHVDCHSSNKGLFAGFIMLVLTVISTILFFIAIYTDEGKQAQIGLTLNIIMSLVMVSLMTVACIFAYTQITKLDLNTAHHNLLDDILLFICIPAYFLNGIFSIIPAIIYANVLGSINICVEVFQVLLQTCFILDGLRRSSNTKELRKKKPGREMVTFLVICNVALWIMQTFEVKSHEMHDNRYDFYGKELWTILGHMCLPLMMFYRFHSSVCIGDIWKYSYEPPGH